MVLYLIGIGLNDEKDISLKGLSIVKKCSKVYLESYTSKLNSSLKKMEKLYGKKVIVADREMVEKKADEILSSALKSDVAFLVIGDVFSATTHTDLMTRAQEKGIKVGVVNNASVLTAVGITGLELYKFGKVTSIPFHHANVKSPVDALKGNQKLGLHTLFLLDLDPINEKFLSVNDAAKYLIKNGVSKDILAVGCARLGSDKPVIKVGKVKDLEKAKIKEFPQSLIIPGKLHFMEEEVLELYS